MIITLYILMFVSSFLFTYLMYRKLLKINFIYTALWCVGGVLVKIGYCGLYEVPDEIHWYILLSVLLVNLTTFVKSRRTSVPFEPHWELTHLNYEILYVMNYASYVFMATIVMGAIRILMTQGWYALRTYAYSPSSMASSFQLMIYAWLVNPIFTVTILITSVLAMSKSVQRKKLIILSIIDLVIITVSFGGRYNIVKAMIFVVSSFFVKRKFRKKQESIKLRYILLGFGVLFLLVYLTSLRSLKGLNFIQNLIIYLYGSIVYFGLLFNKTAGLTTGTLQYGNLTFGIFTSIPMYLFYQFGGQNLTPEFVVDQMTDPFLYIGDTIRYNAFATWLYSFWRDFGAVGIALGTIFVMLLFFRYCRRVERYRKLQDYCILLFIIYVICTSTLTYHLMTIQEVVTLILLVAITKNAKLKE